MAFPLAPFLPICLDLGRSSFEADPGSRELPPSSRPELPISGRGDYFHSTLNSRIPDITVSEPTFNVLSDSGSVPTLVDGRREAIPRELVELRDAAIDLRISTGRDRQNYMEQRRFTMEYLAESLDATRSLLSQIPVDSSIVEDLNSLQRLHKRLVESTDRLKSRENSLCQDELKLNILEDRLLQEENTYYGTTIEQHSVPPIFHSVSFGRGFMPEPAPPSPTSSNEDKPELVRRYYERLNNANLLRDDLINFPADYQRAVDKRTARRMRGEIVKPSEWDFVKKYARKRKTKLRKFESARKDVLRLRQECIESGFEMDDLEIPPFDEEYCPDPLTRIPESFIQHASSLDAGDQKRSDELLVKDQDATGRVATWVEQVCEHSLHVPVSTSVEVLPSKSTTNIRPMPHRSLPDSKSHEYDSSVRPQQPRRHKSSNQIQLSSQQFTRKRHSDSDILGNNAIDYQVIQRPFGLLKSAS